MNKLFIVVLALLVLLLASDWTFAGETSKSEFSKQDVVMLKSLKSVLQNTRKLLDELSNSIQKKGEEYNKSSFWAFQEKNKLVTENCKNIEMALDATLVLVPASLVLSYDTIIKLDLPSEAFSIFEKNMVDHGKLSYSAFKNCKDFTKSFQDVKSSTEAFDKGSSILMFGIEEVLKESEEYI